MGLSAALPLPIFGENILVGATGLVGHATTYHLSETLRNLALTSGGTIDWESRLRENKATSYFFDLVVGTQVHLLDGSSCIGFESTPDHFSLYSDLRLLITGYKRCDTPSRSKARCCIGVGNVVISNVGL